ncbi:MAG: hypothetical protein AB7U73_12065 [Pirellulales bacterium]
MQRLIMGLLVLLGFALLATPGLLYSSGLQRGPLWPIGVAGILVVCFAPLITRKLAGKPKNPGSN